MIRVLVSACCMTLLVAALTAAAALALPESEPKVALAEMVRAVNAGDAHAYAALYAPDAVTTIYGGDQLQGRSAIEEYEVGLLREFPGARLGFQTIWRKGPVVVVHYAVNGRTAGGQAMGHEGLLFYRFLPSGLIAEERRYLDSLTPMAQLGALGAVATRPLPAVPGETKGYEAGLANGSRERARMEQVKASLAALDSNHSAAFLAGLTPDAVVDEMVEARPFVGRRDVAAWLEKWTRAVSGAKTEITRMVCVGDSVLVETVLRGDLNGTLGPVTASARPFTVHRGLAVQLKAGRIGHIRAFMNGKELAQSVGQWPPAPSK
jgi:ketosteroid isomerase-like protein/limonene-1,2-epoxide hydrolase